MDRQLLRGTYKDRFVVKKVSIGVCLGLPLACALALAGCGANRRSFFGGDIRLDVAVAPHANRDSPVPVDLLVFYDEKALEAALAMSSGQWFSAREQFRLDHPKGYQSWSWEWVPGQTVPSTKLSFGIGSRAGLVFADYSTPGAHRVRFDPHSNLAVKLDETAFTVEPRP